MGHHYCCKQRKVKRGLWSPEEDEKLISYINTNGYGCWSQVPEQAGLQRCGKSCRLRWLNYLRPDIKRGGFTPEEEKLIVNLHAVAGNRSNSSSSSSPPAITSTPAIVEHSQTGYDSTQPSGFDLQNQEYFINTTPPELVGETFYPSPCTQFMFDTAASENNNVGAELNYQQAAMDLNSVGSTWNQLDQHLEVQGFQPLAMSFTPSSMDINFVQPFMQTMGNLVPLELESCGIDDDEEAGDVALECNIHGGHGDDHELNELVHFQQQHHSNNVHLWDNVIHAGDQSSGSFPASNSSNMASNFLSSFPSLFGKE
ncbi:hypothetical protein FNV43_RR09325 [Rhamnella rubrinervis]|uniref:Uncharacterized protein n=1 Tax=Rhamnella rubrinervis TaxID=2594499 RepID=A0A8K0MJW0_9ROSA|nr:hypothetical protein FNV43_RR09325 [Rhamnella rubrinervis]